MQKFSAQIIVSMLLLTLLIIAAAVMVPLSNAHVQDPSLKFAWLLENQNLSTPEATVKEEFFTFGDQAGQAIFLELSNPPAGSPVDFALTIAPTEADLMDGHNQSNPNICANQAADPAPEMTPALPESGPTAPWIRLSAKITSFFDDQYTVDLWDSSSELHGYILVEGQFEHGAPSLCADTVEEGV